MNNEKKHFDVLCIGGIVRDIFTRPSDSKILTLQDPSGSEKLLCFEHGGKVNTDAMDFTRGGGACNAAVSFTRLGFSSVLHAAIGGDEIGDDLRHELQDQGVHCSYLQVHPQNKTGLSVVINTFDGDRTILLFRGANDEFTLEKSTLEKFSSVPWIYLTSMSGRDVERSLEVLTEHLSQTGTKLSFNPGGAHIKLGKEKLLPILKKTNILFMNLEEAEELTGIPACVYTTSTQNNRTVGSREDHTDQILRELFSYGPELVVITNGKKGTTAFDGKQKYYFGIYPQHVVDTLGAGDAFGSAFTASYMQSPGDVVKALQLGTANATSVVSFYGAQQGLLSFEKAKALVNDHPELKVEVSLLSLK